MQKKLATKNLTSEIESKVELLIFSLAEYEGSDKKTLYAKLEEVFGILENINNANLLTLLFKVQTMEWLLHFTLAFKQKYYPRDEELNTILLGMTEPLLVNFRASMMVFSGAKSLPKTLTEISERSHQDSQSMSKDLEKSFFSFFEFYVVKKTGSNNPQNRAVTFSELDKKAADLFLN